MKTWDGEAVLAGTVSEGRFAALADTLHRQPYSDEITAPDLATSGHPGWLRLTARVEAGGLDEAIGLFLGYVDAVTAVGGGWDVISVAVRDSFATAGVPAEQSPPEIEEGRRTRERRRPWHRRSRRGTRG